jgi:hypothetical protein
MNKTGTSSLTAALYRLGFPCLHNAKTVKQVAAQSLADGRCPLGDLVARYAAFCDSPINSMFQELDAAYPGSKFIVTVRQLDQWVRSRQAQFRGTPELHLQKYHDHMERVKKHFEGRADDILYFNICAGDGWRPLCSFLGVPIPAEPFPWRNKEQGVRLHGIRLPMSVLQNSSSSCEGR